MLCWLILDALRAVGGQNDEPCEGKTISELALDGIKNIVQNADTAVDMHSAVYMFHFVQALIRHVSDKNAYSIHVGKWIVVRWN